MIKPFKITRQKNETIKDAYELVEYISDGIKVGRKKVSAICANLLDNPRDFIDRPENITSQMIDIQKEIGITDDNKGKRIYPVIYKLPKSRYKVNVKEVYEITETFLNKHKDFQGVATISENKNDISITIVFNNYSKEGDKMTKGFKPATMTNLYIKKLKGKDRGNELLV